MAFRKLNYVFRKIDSEEYIRPENNQYWLSNTEMYFGVDVLRKLQKKRQFSQKNKE